MARQDDKFTTLKISKANLNRLFKLKQSPEDTYDVVITRLLNDREKVLEGVNE